MGTPTTTRPASSPPRRPLVAVAATSVLLLSIAWAWYSMRPSAPASGTPEAIKAQQAAVDAVAEADRAAPPKPDAVEPTKDGRRPQTSN